MLNNECGWKDGDRSVNQTSLETNKTDQPNCLGKTNSLLTPTGLLMEGTIHILIG
jgi:hypothetical protein